MRPEALGTRRCRPPPLDRFGTRRRPGRARRAVDEPGKGGAVWQRPGRGAAHPGARDSARPACGDVGARRRLCRARTGARAATDHRRPDRAPRPRAQIRCRRGRMAARPPAGPTERTHGLDQTTRNPPHDHGLAHRRRHLIAPRDRLPAGPQGASVQGDRGYARNADTTRRVLRRGSHPAASTRRRGRRSPSR